MVELVQKNPKTSEQEHTELKTPHLIIFKRGEEQWSAEASESQTIFEVARAALAPVETLCHGIGACVRCKVKLLEGELTSPTPLERDRLGNIFHLTKERLACQARVCGSVTLEICTSRRKRRTVRDTP